jgi:predicted alpha-1,6-mannanase (GH76 family)
MICAQTERTAPSTLRRPSWRALVGACGLLWAQGCGGGGSGGGRAAGGAGDAQAGTAGFSGAAGTSLPTAFAGHDGGAIAGSGGAAGTAGANGDGGLTDAGGASGFGDAAAGASGTGGVPAPPWDDSLRARATAGMVPLQSWYDATTGLWNKTDWWTSANQLETVIDYSRETGDPTYLDDVDTTFVKNQAGDFDHFGFYDDDGWWAMSWIKAYDLSHQQKYLDMAKTIFKRMSGGWDDKCGGGIYWASAKAGSDGLKNKNAIPNSLFLQVAAQLHERTPGDTGAGSFLDWAQREWAWFKGTGMLTSKNQVVDGLDGLTTCKPAGPVFTYNQGVLVGALVDLAAGTGDATLLDQAGAIAHATLTTMVDASGTLKEAPCGGDVCTQFKGVFMRNLAALYRVRPLAEYQTFMRHQSDQLWNSNRNAQDQFGYEWQLPFDKATASRQSSALDALVAAVMSSNMNLSLVGATATGSASCSASEIASNVLDGSARWGSKWCSAGAGAEALIVDLGASRKVVGFRVRHAGAGGEDAAWNTRDFELDTSADGQAWARAATVVGNTASITTHSVTPLPARFARLHVTTAQSATNIPAARIYELEIFGVGL